ncbi:hypothetical protein Save01_08538 [Streptomyces avermitilis]|nr:hypothetical protein SAVMC3_01220 [Streptomyces avermitilis]GDY68981.1 hypothetical protein SAV14893_083740 [Streptomyces avermitilis]GDY70636.1 hypothetical protein SAV31267_001210 [Streptomyces avermitilis]
MSGRSRRPGCRKLRGRRVRAGGIVPFSPAGPIPDPAASRMQKVIHMTSRHGTTTLWRPTGPKELDLVRELKWRAWPARLLGQPFFYPVLNEDYAVKIARDWNVKHDGAGFVTRFEVESQFLRRYPVRQAGGQTILELWVPAAELDDFNAHMAGEIEVVHEFR